MHVIGIICEYNPFHNGHLYHLKKIKELYPDSLIILVLNGYFLERGEISIISKINKTKIALEYGIDIVLELPFVYGTQSADIFADISLKMLNNFKCEYLIFGSESNNIEKLNKFVDYTINNTKEYNNNVKNYLDKGINYPSALAKALNIDYKLDSNDLLGISYLKAIKQNNYNIKPITIKRTNNYLDILDDTDIISATNIRNKLYSNIDIKKYIPEYNNKYINNINLNNLFNYLNYKIISEKDLSIYLDVDEGIEFRLKKIIHKVNNTDELINKIKSKRYTFNKIRRMLIHILIGLTKEDNKKLKLDYIKILGFSKKGQKYLKNIKKELKIDTLINKNSLIYKYELVAAEIYDLVTNEKNYDIETNNKPEILLKK